MRRVLSWLLTISVAAAYIATSNTLAHADTECSQTDPMTGVCLVWVEVPATPDDAGDEGDDVPKDTGKGNACVWDGTAQASPILPLDRCRAARMRATGPTATTAT